MIEDIKNFFLEYWNYILLSISGVGILGIGVYRLTLASNNQPRSAIVSQKKASKEKNQVKEEKSLKTKKVVLDPVIDNSYWLVASFVVYGSVYVTLWLTGNKKKLFLVIPLTVFLWKVSLAAFSSYYYQVFDFMQNLDRSFNSVYFVNQDSAKIILSLVGYSVLTASVIYRKKMKKLIRWLKQKFHGIVRTQGTPNGEYDIDQMKDQWYINNQNNDLNNNMNSQNNLNQNINDNNNFDQNNNIDNVNNQNDEECKTGMENPIYRVLEDMEKNSINNQNNQQNMNNMFMNNFNNFNNRNNMPMMMFNQMNNNNMFNQQQMMMFMRNQQMMKQQMMFNQQRMMMFNQMNNNGQW